MQKTFLQLGDKWTENNYGKYYKTFLMFLTDKCNLRCKVCFNKSNLGNGQEMSFEYVKQIIDVNADIDKYDIMGGEPLLHPEIDKILRYLESKEKKIGLYTNGFLLSKLKKNYNNLKINMAFHAIDAQDPSLKPIKKIEKVLLEYQEVYPMKICYLMSKSNASDFMEFVSYVERTFSKIKKITVGALRDESDYWNYKKDDIINDAEYIATIQSYLKNYKGNLDLDIFTEGILDSINLPKSQHNQINRFKCIYPGFKYTECLYDIGIDKKKSFTSSDPINFCESDTCPKYGDKNCLTDKIKLIRRG